MHSRQDFPRLYGVKAGVNAMFTHGQTRCRWFSGIIKRASFLQNSCRQMPAGVGQTHGVPANPNLRKATLFTSIALWPLSGMFHLQALFLLVASYSVICGIQSVPAGSTFLSIFSHSSGATRSVDSSPPITETGR